MTNPPPAERRTQPRIAGPFPVRVRGMNAAGRVFQTHTVADDLSLGGLYLQLPARVAPGARLSTRIRLPGGATVIAHCSVLRAEAKPHGLSGLALRFNRTRLMPTLPA